MKYRREENHYILVLDRGEEITETLTRFVAGQNIEGGRVKGIGGVTEVELGFFDTAGKEYLRRRLDGFFELASLVGDISIVDGKPFCHLHAVVSDSEMRAWAGHLFNAEVSVTAEIFVIPGEKTLRSFDEEVGLNLIDL